jgi:DNA polymerase
VSDLFAAADYPSLAALAAAEAACTRCPLYRDATRVVPGEGPRDATLMFVGEQPGEEEDRTGRPFVGPAGRVFDAALARVGIARDQVFVTNAVKHFKFTRRGRRRIHQKPAVAEIDHCRWWLDLERGLLRPRLVVAMGATAARGVFRRQLAIAATRGTVRAVEGGHGLVTIHPSYLLRLDDDAAKRREWNAFLDDLAVARDWLAGA